MCGICAFVGVDGEARVTAMTAALGHRGPDGGGTFRFDDVHVGMRRLAVMDPTSNADQPMLGADGRVALVYNGELYNFRALAQELDAGAAPRSDTAVLLELYLRRGIAFADRLEGMFAFAILDARASRPKLILGRDRLGIKPLWLAEQGAGFFAASELRTLVAGGVAADVDDDSLFDLLLRGSVGQPASLLRGVASLRPGSTLTIEGGTQTLRVMPALERVIVAPRYEDRVVQVRQAVERAVRAQLQSDVPVGAFLSGGVDSAVVAAAAAASQPKLPLFTAAFHGNVELEGARRSAEHLGLSLTEVDLESITGADFARFAAEMDQPTVDGFNTWALSRAVRSSVTVALSGTGGDETFGGYPWFAQMLATPSLRRRIATPFAAVATSALFDPLIGPHRPGRFLERLRSLESRSARFARLNMIFDVIAAARLVPGSKERDPVRLREDVDDAEDDSDDGVFRWTSKATVRHYLQSQLLRDIDVASMAHGLEVRVPLLDEHLVALGQALPARDKIDARRANAATYAESGAKRILIDAFAAELRPGLAQQRKTGFALPFDRWLRGPLREVVEDALHRPSATIGGRLDAGEIDRVWQGFLGGSVGWPAPWLLAVLSLWYDGIRP